MARVKTLVKLSVLGVITLGALALWRIRKSPQPEEYPDVGSDLESRVETFTTEDGVALRLKHYVNRGGQPVLMAHGFLGNGLEFDLPHPEHNLAVYLAKRGYDVWISSFRGCGRKPYTCEATGWDHSVDHLAALDAPALVKGVAESTGRLPIWIGHSMGGIVLYLYLQGIKLESSDGGFKVAIDRGLAEERNRSIAGGITIGSPSSLHFGGGDWIARLSRLPLFERTVASLIRLLKRMNDSSPRLPITEFSAFVSRFPRVGRVLAMRGPIAMGLYYTENVDPDVGYSLIKHASDSVSTRMTIQILALGVDPDLKCYNGECNFNRNMGLITAPLFFITGTEDFAGSDNIREHGYGQVSSLVKDYRCFDGYGHCDLVMGKRVQEEVYPVIMEWIERLP